MYTRVEAEPWTPTDTDRDSHLSLVCARLLGTAAGGTSTRSPSTWLLAKDGLDPPHPAVPGALLALRRRVRVRRLAELGHVVPFLLGTLHQLVVHGLVHLRLPAKDLHAQDKIMHVKGNAESEIRRQDFGKGTDGFC